MTKKVLFEPSGEIHGTHWTLINYPPEGYEFLVENNRGFMDKLAGNKLFLQYYLALIQKPVLEQLPSSLLKAYLQRSRKISSDVCLTFAYNHVVFRNEPWIAQLEYPTMLAGFSTKALGRVRNIVEARLASANCKRILCWSEVARKSMFYNLDCSGFADKIEVMPHAVPSPGFKRQYGDDGSVRLLFVSSHAPGEAVKKGLAHVIEAYRRLRGKYDNISLMIRSDIPHDLKPRLSLLKGVEVIDRFLAKEEFVGLFQQADLFIRPTLHAAQDIALLDAMSYGLPVITTDYGANAEMVEHGETGFVVRPKHIIPEYGEGLVPVEHTQGRSYYYKVLDNVQGEIVDGLVDYAGRLIEDNDLRTKMSRAACSITETRYSVSQRNIRLRQIFEEAIAPAV